MRKRFILILLVISGLAVPAFAITQGQWAKQLVESLRWNGKDARPVSEEQAIQMLMGQQNDQFDLSTRVTGAHNAFQSKDLSRTPSPWASASSQPGQVSSYLVVQRPGFYAVNAYIKAVAGQAQSWRVGNHKKLVNFQKSGWSMVEVGEFELPSGVVPIVIDLPAQSGVASVSMKPLCADPVVPKGGLQSDGPLTYPQLAQMVSVLGEGTAGLSQGEFSIIKHADELRIMQGAVITKDDAENGLRTIEADSQKVRVNFSAQLPIDQALYRVMVEARGMSDLSWRIGRCPKKHTLSDPNAFQWYTVTVLYLNRGQHNLNLSFGQGAQIRRLRVDALDFGPQSTLVYARRFGLNVDPERPNRLVSSAKVEQLLGQEALQDLAFVYPDHVPLPEWAEPDVQFEDDAFHEIVFHFDQPASPVLPSDIATF